MKRIISVLLLTMYMVTNFTFSVSATVDPEFYTTNLLGDEYYNCDADTLAAGGVMGDAPTAQKFTEEVSTAEEAYDGIASIKLTKKGKYLFKKKIEENLLGETVNVSFMFKGTTGLLSKLTTDARKQLTLYYQVHYTETIDEVPTEGTTSITSTGTIANIDGVPALVDTNWMNYNIGYTFPTIDDLIEDGRLTANQTVTGVSVAVQLGLLANLSTLDNTTAGWIDQISLYAVPAAEVLATTVSSMTNTDNADGKTASFSITLDTEYVNNAGLADMDIICDGETLSSADYTAVSIGNVVIIALATPAYIKSISVAGIKDMWGRNVDCSNAALYIPRETTKVTSLVANNDENDKTHSIELTLNNTYVDADSISDIVVDFSGTPLYNGADYTVTVDGAEITITFTPPKLAKDISVTGIKDIWGEDVDCTDAKLNILRETTKVTSFVANNDAEGKTTSIELALNTEYVDSLEDMVVTLNGVDLTSGTDYEAAIEGRTIIILISEEAQKVMSTVAVSGIKDIWGDDVDCTEAYAYGVEATNVDRLENIKGTDDKTAGIEVILTTTDINDTGFADMVVTVDGTELRNGNDYTAVIENANLIGSKKKIVVTFDKEVYAKEITVSDIQDTQGQNVDCSNAVLTFERDKTAVIGIFNNKDANGNTTTIDILLDNPYVDLETISGMEVVINTVEKEVGIDYELAIDGNEIIIILSTPTIINTCEVKGIYDLWGDKVDCTKATFDEGLDAVAVKSIAKIPGTEEGMHSGLELVFDSPYVTEDGLDGMIVKVNGETLSSVYYTTALSEETNGNKNIIITFTSETAVESAAVAGIIDQFGRRVDVSNAVIAAPITRATYTTNLLGEEYTIFDDISLAAKSWDCTWQYSVSDDSISGSNSLMIERGTGTGIGRNVIAKTIPILENEAPKNMRVSFYVKASKDIRLSDGAQPYIDEDGEYTFYQMRFTLQATYRRPDGTTVTSNIAKMDKQIIPDYPEWQYVSYDFKDIDYRTKVEGNDIPEDGTLVSLTFISYIHNSIPIEIVQGYILMDKYQVLSIPEDDEYHTIAMDSMPADGEQNANSDKVVFTYDGPVRSFIDASDVIIKEGNSADNLTTVDMPVVFKTIYNEVTEMSYVSIIPEEGFVNGKYYEVTLRNAYDFWGREISGSRKVSFKAKDEFIAQPAYGAATMITKSGDAVTGAKVKLTNNNGAASRDAVLVSAITDECGNIKSYRISQSARVAANGGETVLASTFASAEVLASGEFAKAFLWDSITNHRPLTDVITEDTSVTSANSGGTEPVSDTEGPMVTYNAEGGDANNGEVIVEGNLDGIAEGQLVSLVVYEKNAGVASGLKWYDVQAAGANGAYDFSCTLAGTEGTEYIFAVAALGHYGEEKIFQYYSKQSGANLVATLTTGDAVAAAIENYNNYLNIDTSVYDSFEPDVQEDICDKIAADMVTLGSAATVSDFKASFNKHCTDAEFAAKKAALSAEMAAANAEVYAYFNAFGEEDKDAILGEIVNANLATDAEEVQLFCDKVLSKAANDMTTTTGMEVLLSLDVIGIDFTAYNYLTEDHDDILAALAAKTDYTDCASIKDAFDKKVNDVISGKTTSVVSLERIVGTGDNYKGIKVILDSKYIDESSVSNLSVQVNGVILTTIDYTIALEEAVYNDALAMNIIITFATEMAVNSAAVSGILDQFGRSIDETNSVIEENKYTCGENCVAIVEDGVITITGTGEVGDFVNYNDEVVYLDELNITKIEIGEGITSVGEDVFRGCESLTELSLPSTLESIARRAFYRCSALADIYYYANEESWGNVSIDSTNAAIKNADIHYIYDIIVSFDATGGVCDVENKIVVNGCLYGELPTPERKGYRFTGWSTDDGTLVTEDSLIEITTDHTLYANWQIQNYSVNFDNNIGTGSSISKEVEYNAAYGVFPIPTRVGYTFMGWFDSPEDGTEVSGDEALEQDNDVTLYAHWKRNEVNSGTCGTNSTWIITPDKKLVISGTGEVGDIFTDLSGNEVYISDADIDTVEIEEGIETINERVFYGCDKNIKRVILPVSLQAIGTRAFYYCDILTDVYYAGSSDDWSQVTVGDKNESIVDNLHYSFMQTEKVFTTDFEGDKLCDIVFKYADNYDLDGVNIYVAGYSEDGMCGAASKAATEGKALVLPDNSNMAKIFYWNDMKPVADDEEITL